MIVRVLVAALEAKVERIGMGQSGCEGSLEHVPVGADFCMGYGL